MEKDLVHPTKVLTPSSALHGLMRSKKCFNIFAPQSEIKREANASARAVSACFLSLKGTITKQAVKQVGFVCYKGHEDIKKSVLEGSIYKKEDKVVYFGKAH